MTHNILASAVRNSNGCLVATAGWNADGYRRTMDGYAHRLVMEAHLGRPLLDPRIESVDHTCHNQSDCPGGPTCPHRACVDIAHLEVVPLTENWRRGRLGSRRDATHCPAGHEYTSDNIRASKNGWRACKTCHREREAARRAQS